MSSSTATEKSTGEACRPKSQDRTGSKTRSFTCHLHADLVPVLERLHFLPDQRRGGDQWLEAIYTHGVFYSRSGQVKSFFGPGASKLSRAKKLDAIIRASDDGGPYPTNQLAKLARIVQLAETGRIAVATAETLAGARRLMVPRDAAPPPLHLQQVLAVPFPGMATAQQVPIYSNLASFVQVQAAAYPGLQPDIQTMARQLQAMQGVEARMDGC